MIPYIYKPVLFNIGPINIYTWGFIVFLSFLISYFLLTKLTKSKKIHNLAFYIILGAFIGARLLNYILFYDSYSSFIEIFKIWQGGLEISGGFIGAFIFGFTYIKLTKLRFWKTADILIIPIVLGIALGRIACIIGDGGHLGKPTKFFLGTLVNNQVLHYTAVYSFIAMFILFLILLYLRNKKFFKTHKGSLFLFAVIYYGVTRFLIDFTRADPTYYGLTFAQYACIILFIIGVLFLILNILKVKKLNPIKF